MYGFGLDEKEPTLAETHQRVAEWFNLTPDELAFFNECQKSDREARAAALAAEAVTE